MSLKLTYYYRMPGSVTNHAAVIGHLREVLNVFASKADCTKFYIGITGNLRNRLRQHEFERPEYTLMCAIHKEEPNFVADSFHNLETAALNTFRQGVLNKATGRILQCGNAVGGSLAQNWLYLLVDKRQVADIPFHSRESAIWGDET